MFDAVCIFVPVHLEPDTSGPTLRPSPEQRGATLATRPRAFEEFESGTHGGFKWPFERPLPLCGCGTTGAGGLVTSGMWRFWWFCFSRWWPWTSTRSSGSSWGISSVRSLAGQSGAHGITSAKIQGGSDSVLVKAAAAQMAHFWKSSGGLSVIQYLEEKVSRVDDFDGCVGEWNSTSWNTLQKRKLLWRTWTSWTTHGRLGYSGILLDVPYLVNIPAWGEVRMTTWEECTACEQEGQDFLYASWEVQVQGTQWLLEVLKAAPHEADTFAALRKEINRGVQDLLMRK